MRVGWNRREFAPRVRGLGVPCDIAELRPIDALHPFVSLKSIAAVVRAARRWGVAVIHANEVPSFQPGGYTARILGIPALTHVRFFDRASGYRWFLRLRFSQASPVPRCISTVCTLRGLR